MSITNRIPIENLDTVAVEIVEQHQPLLNQSQPQSDELDTSDENETSWSVTPFTPHTRSFSISNLSPISNLSSVEYQEQQDHWFDDIVDEYVLESNENNANEDDEKEAQIPCSLLANFRKYLFEQSTFFDKLSYKLNEKIIKLKQSEELSRIQSPTQEISGSSLGEQPSADLSQRIQSIHEVTEKQVEYSIRRLEALCAQVKNNPQDRVALLQACTQGENIANELKKMAVLLIVSLDNVLSKLNESEQLKLYDSIHHEAIGARKYISTIDNLLTKLSVMALLQDPVDELNFNISIEESPSISP